MRRDLECYNGQYRPKVSFQPESGREKGLMRVGTSVNGLNMCVNNYDVRLTDTHPACGMNWPPDLADITPYLQVRPVPLSPFTTHTDLLPQRPDVKAAFHANRKDGRWVECNGIVGSQFYAKDSAPSVQLLPALLEKIEILLFAGDQDLICVSCSNVLLGRRGTDGGGMVESCGY